MNGLKLNEAQNLLIERDQKRLRLVVYKNGDEEVCRKEYLRNINRFLLTENNRLFKGRLQLNKIADRIDVVVKGKTAGSIYADVFSDYLRTINTNSSAAV